MYQLTDYDYHLPESLIAQEPCAERNASRLLRINRSTHDTGHHRFVDLEKFLRPKDLLVVNNTRVIPARLMGKKQSGGRVEVLIQTGDDRYRGWID